MTRIVEWLARRLPVEEQDAVLGDLAEAGSSPGRAIGEVLGLIVRRQLFLWKTWQPWIALVGITGLVGMVLSEILVGLTGSLYLQLRTYLRYGVHYSTGLTLSQDITHLVCLSLALCAWAWTGGFVVGYLSGRTIWINAPLFCLVCLDSFWVRMRLSSVITNGDHAWLLTALLPFGYPLSLPMFLILIPALWGMSRGRRGRVPVMRRSLFLAAVTMILTLGVMWTRGWHNGVMERWSEGAMHSAPSVTQLPLLLAGWPALYMLWIANIRHRRTRTS